MKLNKQKYELLLARKNMTIKELSILSGVSTVTLGKIRGGSICQPITIGKIASAFNVDVLEITEE